MKHTTSTTANGLCTPPCGSSHGNLSSFRFRNSLLMPLMMLFLLIVGTNAAWGIETHYIAGEGWTGSTWNQKDLAMTALRSDTVYYLIPAEKITGQIKFKLNPASDPGDWSKQLNSNNIDNTQTYSNVNLTSVDDQRLTLSTTITSAKKNDIYIFTNGTKVWALAVPIYSSQLPDENTAKPYTMMDLRLRDDNEEWKGYDKATRFTDKANDNNSYTKHTLAYIIPAVGSGETDGSGAKVRIEYYDASQNCKKSNKTPGIPITSSPKRAIVLWDGSSTSPANPLIVDYPVRKSGWKLYVNSSLAGTTDANGDVVVNNLASGDVTFYLTNGEESKLYQGINWFGGLYIKRSSCSGVTLGSQQYGKGSTKNGVYLKPIVGKHEPQGKFTLSQVSNVTFNFNGGDITINAVESGTILPTDRTYDGTEYMFFHKNQTCTEGAHPIMDFSKDDARLYVHFKNASTSVENTSERAFFWDADKTILAVKVPAGTYKKFQIYRISRETNGWYEWNHSYELNLDYINDYNYLSATSTTAPTWTTYTPPTFRFVLSGTAAMTGDNGDFAHWNGNGTVYTGSTTKILNSGTYKFKINPAGVTTANNMWVNEFNWNDIDLANSSNDISLRKNPADNNTEIWFDLATQSEVTIACDGSKVTVNATPYVPALTNEELYVFGAGGTNWVTGWSTNWDSEDYKMTISAGIASKTFYNVSGSGLRFKIRNKTAGDAQYKYDMIDAGACSGITDLGDCDNNLNICFSLAQTSDVTVYTDGTHVWLTAVPSAIVYDGTEYIFMDRRQCGYSETIAANDATCWVEFSNGSQSAGSQYPAFVCDENTLATLAPAGSWTKVRVGRGDRTTFTDGWNGWGSGNWLYIVSKDYNKITAQAAGWETYSFPNSKFYLATPNDVYYSEGAWSWNGDGTLHTNSVTITLAKDQLFKFKLTRNYVAKSDVRWSMEGNYTHYDAAHSNLSNTECTNYSNNQIQIQLDRKADVTITWENYDKIVITKTPYYNVIFDSDGGSAMDAQELRSGEKATNPGTPERGSGYTFNFWKLRGESIAYDFSTPVTSDIELVADWTAPTLYTVTFDSNGGSPVDAQEVVENETATEPADPTRDNYTFGGWKLGNVLYTFSTPVTGNITLVASWTYAPAHISSVSINYSSIYTWQGDATTYTLIPTLVPADIASVTVSWSSSDNNVATVENGVITPQRAGTATITCTATDYYSGSQTATCAVKVAPCAKELAGAPSYNVTITGYNSYEDGDATLTGMWNESSDNTEPATLTVCNVRIGNNGGSNEYYAYDNNGTVSIEQRSSDNVDKWYRIEAATNLYYLKNVSTGNYMYVGPTNTSGSKGIGWTTNSGWYLRSVFTSAANGKTDNYKFYCTKDEWNNDIIVSRADATNNTSRVQENDFVLSRQQLTGNPGNVWNDVVANMVAASRGATQGGNNYKGFQSAFENVENVTNPAYIQSQMNSSYYRMKANATVQANLGSALAEADVISVELYADAATSVTLCKTNGDVVATINLNADAATEYTYLVTAGTPLDGENAFIIKAADNHAGIRSIAVTPMVTANPAQPDLHWTTTPVTAHLLLDGNFTYTAASNDSQGAISYASEDIDVAQVDASTGEVTPSGAGTTNIIATIAADECYTTYSISYKVSFLGLQDYIATDGVNSVTLPGDYAGENIVINKPFTINGAGHSIGDLTVEAAGDLTLSGALTVNDFSIYAKAGNTTTPAASGQVRNATNLTANGNAYFYYTVDPNGHVQYGWYDFTVPFRVNVMTGIKGIQEGVLNEDFVNERDYAVMEHLGEKQAAGEYAYKKFRGVMEPCRLYSITLDPQNNYNTIRFQKADGDLVADNSVTLNSYYSAVDDKHANWNGVGNGTLHHADAGLSVAIQVYQSGNKTFLPVSPTAYSLVIGSAFMVQQTGTMTLNQATHDKLLAPRRAASVQPTAIQIASEGQPFSDQLFISADEMAGQVYTQGADVAKAGNIGNVNVPQIWTNAYNSKLCAHEAQLINGEASYTLSLYAPANGSYTLTSKNIPEGYTLYLTQNGNRIWDLSERYVLDLTKGTATEYGLLLVERYNAPTAVENIGSKADETQKIMHNGILYILRNGKVFNAQGARVK